MTSSWKERTGRPWCVIFQARAARQVSTLHTHALIDSGYVCSQVYQESAIQVFQVRWRDHNGWYANHTTMKVYLDGHIAGKTHCAPGFHGKRVGIRTVSADTYQPYQFSDLQTTGASIVRPRTCAWASALIQDPAWTTGRRRGRCAVGRRETGVDRAPRRLCPPGHPDGSVQARQLRRHRACARA